MRRLSSLSDNLYKANVCIPDFKVCVLGNGRNSTNFLSKWIKHSFNNRNIQEIKYGKEALESNNIYKLPVDFLESSNASLVHIPRFSEQDPGIVNSLVQNSCWVILVTDSNHILSKSEKHFLSDYAGKPNLSLMVNILPESDENHVDKDLKEELGQDNIPKDLVKLKEQDDLMFLSEKFTLLKQSKQVLQDSAVYYAKKRLNILKDELEISKNNLHSIGEFLKQLQAKIQAKEEQINSNFREIDMVILEQDLAEVVLGLRTFFKNYSFWKLFYKSDYLAEDLQVVLRDYSLMNGELQMAYSMGKLEQGRLNLIETLKQDLEKISSRYPDLESDISRIIDLVDATSKESVDPFLLRDQVVSFVEPVETLELQNQADSIARYSLGVQMSWAGLTLWISQVDTATALWALPSSTVAAGLLLAWLRLRWGSYQDLFIAKLGLSHKRLSENVTKKFQSEFKNRIHDSTQSFLNVTKEATKSHLQKISKRQQDINSLLDYFKGLKNQ